MSDYELQHAYDTVNLQRKGGVARIELNRPEKLNAWNAQFGADLLAAIERVAQDDKVRAVEIVGAGRAFSSGADLTDMADDHPVTENGRPDVYRVLTERYHPIIRGVREMPKPVVAAVRGPAVGIGCSLALACDLIVASDDAYLLLAFVNVGLVPDGGSSLFIPAAAGKARAFEMALLGERIPAEQALQWGLINRVWPADEFAARTDELVTRLAGGPTRSFAGSKRQLNNRIYWGFEEQLELEARIQREMAATDDFVEGVMAFAQKRDAAFKGS